MLEIVKHHAKHPPTAEQMQSIGTTQPQTGALPADAKSSAAATTAPAAGKAGGKTAASAPAMKPQQQTTEAKRGGGRHQQHTATQTGAAAAAAETKSEQSERFAARAAFDAKTQAGTVWRLLPFVVVSLTFIVHSFINLYVPLGAQDADGSGRWYIAPRDQVVLACFLAT